jgi:hypothetical protein
MAQMQDREQQRRGKKNLHTAMLKCTQNNISWEYDILCGNKGDKMKESNDV